MTTQFSSECVPFSVARFVSLPVKGRLVLRKRQQLTPVIMGARKSLSAGA
jgi:hypothetical protein